ncbi:MAG: hypothetical protein IKZ55_03615, partial [Bacteroidales bacterium]|nr:hypothetical protein [Bacteroidales bacterium]
MKAKKTILVLIAMFSLAANALWAQTVVTCNTGAQFKTYLEATANYTIRVTGNFTMTNAMIVVPSGYTKTVVGWNASSNATTERTITRGGTSCAITMNGGTVTINNINFYGNNHVCNYSMFTQMGGTVNFQGNCSFYNCKGSTATTGYAFLSDSYYSNASVNNSGTLIIRNGSGGGGAIDFQGYKFTNSGTLKVYSNKNTGSNTFAGGMSVGYTSTVTNTGTIEIYSNTSPRMAGGLACVDNCTFNNNGTLKVYNNTAAENGGGIWCRSTFNNNGTLTVTGNKGTHGGGIFLRSGGGGTFTCGSSSTMTVSGNTATASDGCGGGMYIAPSVTCSLANATINGTNKAVYGAGIFNEGTLKFQTKACTISKNTATSIGGGMFLNPGGTVTFSVATTISDNVAVDAAGGVFLQANATFPSYVTISGNNGGTNGAGGGVYVDGVTLTMTGATISNNTAAEGGGIANDGTLNCTGTNTMTITGNKATNGNGGGILTYASRTLNLSSTGTKTFTKNTATNGNGGAIGTANGGTLTNCTIGGSTANKNEAKNGGGVYLESGTLTVSGGTYTYNTATENGGGIHLNGGSVTFSNSPNITYNNAKNGGGIYTNINVTLPNGLSVSNNTASGSGGGVYVPSGKTLTLQNPTINSNTAAAGGGGIYNLGTVGCTGSYALTMTGNKTTGNHGGAIHNRGTLTLTSTGAKSFSNNTSNGSGGAIINYEGGTMTLNNGTFSFTNNTATNNHGGAIYTNTALNMSGASSVTFTGNTAKVHGGGIFATGVAVTLSATANTLTNNKGGQGAAGNGGAVSCAGLTCAGALTMTDNQAGTADFVGHGGGIYSTGAVTLSGSTAKTINTNKAPKGNGGAIWTGGGGTLTGCTVGASGKANSAVNGGGVFLNAGPLTVSGGTYTYNTATTAGGGFYLSGGSATFSGTVSVANNGATDGAGIYSLINLTLPSTVTVSNNTATTNGGGIFIGGAKTLTLNGTVSGNSANWGGGIYTKWSEANTVVCNAGTAVNSNTASTNGGGFYIHNGCTLSIAGATNINSNTATSDGGGVFVAASGTMTCTGSIALTMTGNTATNGHGGAIHNTGTLTLSSSGAKSFTKNKATNGNGGAIYNNGTATLTGLTVGTSGNANTATNGAGVYQSGGTLSVNSGSYTYNEATGNGGGFCLMGGTATFAGSPLPAIHHNQAGNGGGIYNGTSLTLPDLAIHDNTATNGGGLYANASSNLSCNSTTFINNTATNGGGIYTEGRVNSSGHIPGTTTETLQRVEYIVVNTASIGIDAPTNVPYINTDISFNGGHKTWARLQRNGAEVFGFYAYTGKGNSQRAGYKPLSGNIQHAWPDKGNTTNSDYTSGTDMTGIFEVEQDYQHIKLTDCNGVVSNFTYSGNASATMGATWTLLRPYVSGSKSMGRLYEAKIWNASNELIGHYIPCRRENGEAGVYDAVSGKFLANAGTAGSFTAGDDVTGQTYTVTVTTTVPVIEPVYDLTLNSCTIGGSTATKNTAAKGGGIYINQGGVNLNTGSSIAYNTASQFGGGMYVATNGELGVSGTVTVKDNTTTRSSSTYDLYLKPSNEDDVCLQTLNDNSNSGNIGKIRLKGDIAGSQIGITEEEVASGHHRSLDAEGNKKRQFTLDYGTHYSNKAAGDVFFSNDKILDIFLLTHPHPGTTTGLLEVTLGAELYRSWYIAGIVDDGGLTWGDDINNSGLAPDVPLRTLTGPQGVFAKGYNPLTDHIFVVRAVSAAAEAAAGRLTDGKVVVRYPNAATAATFFGNTTAIADESGSEEVILHRY